MQSYISYMIWQSLRVELAPRNACFTHSAWPPGLRPRIDVLRGCAGHRGEALIGLHDAVDFGDASERELDDTTWRKEHVGRG